MSATTKFDNAQFEDEEHQEQWDDLNESVIEDIDLEQVRDELEYEELDYDANELDLAYFQGLLVRVFENKPYDEDDGDKTPMSSLEEYVTSHIEECFNNHIEAFSSDFDSEVSALFIEKLKEVHAVEIYKDYCEAFEVTPKVNLKRSREEENNTTTKKTKV